MYRKLFVFSAIDRKLFGEEMATNRYFTTLSFVFFALVGACSGASHLVASVFSTEHLFDFSALIGCLLFVVALNICESLMASERVWTGIARAFAVSIALLFCVVLSYYLSVVGICLGVAYLAFLFISLVINWIRNSRKEAIYLADGTKLFVETDPKTGAKTYLTPEGERYERRADGEFICIEEK